MNLVTPAHMFPLNKNIRHSPLPAQLFQIRLNFGPVGHLVEVDEVEGNLEVLEEVLGLVAVGTVTFSEHLCGEKRVKENKRGKRIINNN